MAEHNLSLLVHFRFFGPGSVGQLVYIVLLGSKKVLIQKKKISGQWMKRIFKKKVWLLMKN